MSKLLSLLDTLIESSKCEVLDWKHDPKEGINKYSLEDINGRAIVSIERKTGTTTTSFSIFPYEGERGFNFDNVPSARNKIDELFDELVLIYGKSETQHSCNDCLEKTMQLVDNIILHG